MSNHFSWMKRFRQDAKQSLLRGCIRDLDFAGPTYLIEFYDPVEKQSYWPFFQFDEAVNLKDAFCSCDASDQGCLHLATAYLKIVGKQNEPLHVRFERSLWNILCQLMAEHTSYDEKFLEKENEGGYSMQNALSFEVHASKKQFREVLEKIVANRPRETPENSLKFSNLPREEIVRWKEGRPTPLVRYRLSFWFDLAKWLMLLQEEEVPYSISFQEDENGMPTSLTVDWEGLSLKFSYPEDALAQIIPSLEEVNSTLKVEKMGERPITQIFYKVNEGVLLIEHAEIETEKPILVGKKIGDWLYVSGKGFILQDGDSLLNKERIPKDQVAEVLERYPRLIAEKLQGEKLDLTPKPLEYVIYFDREWNWHFDPFLFEKGDLQKQGSALLDNWAYLKGKGFYRVEGVLFPEIQTTISSMEVAQFVNHHRVWLNNRQGFQTHLAGIESHLSYSMTPEGILKFQTKAIFEEEVKDFGEWVFYPSLGFFSKRHARLGLVVRPGLEVSAKKISSFIRANKEELENISGFFSSRMPIRSLGLELGVKSLSSIFVKPVVEFDKGLSCRIFKDFVFTEGEGFYELPLSMRLPEEFQEERVIGSEFLYSFFANDYPSLQKYVLKMDSRLKLPHVWTLEVRYLARRREGGLKAHLVYLTEIGEIPVAEIRENYFKKRRYLFSNAGLIDLHDERFQWVRHLNQPHDEEGSMLEFSTMEFIRLDSAFSLRTPVQEGVQGEILQRLLRELREFTTPDIPVLKNLKSDLRLYQETGVKWLWFLYHNELSGLLCDEMGLGKTHQAMALIAAIISQLNRECYFLVVCPTSVIYHWEDKLAAFLPSVKVHTFHGVKRSLRNLPSSGVILTSYGILRSEKETFKKIHFELAIFDEVQIAKNAQSRVHQALMQIDAKMRLGLTGTPIENNLRELKSLFDITLPGYMPSEARFRELFIIPIERKNDDEKKALLSQMIRPFMLRRKKSEVLQELPEKSIDNAYCDLSEQQVKLYRETLELNREALLEGVQNGKKTVSYIHVFSLLTRLKQICDHPALVAKDPKNYKKYQSGKWDLFVELLSEAQESQQKVVIFSQYLHMLDIMETYFQEEGWKYAQIRGSTIDRREEIRRFQEEEDCKIFIGSLQAAGVGIDLTAASVVILYDRWWNPARENQAIDRVHRIGQKWAVQVFKLIAKNTIEEKIDRMIVKKGRLLEEIVSADEQAVLKQLTREDLIELLSY